VGVALLVGLAGANNGPSNSTASTAVAAVWNPNSSRFDVTYHTNAVGSDATRAYLLFRYPNQAGSPTNGDPGALIDIKEVTTGNDPPFTDDPLMAYSFSPQTVTFQYIDPSSTTATAATGTLTANYNHFPMEPGTAYQYAVGRVGVPEGLRGQGGPVTTAQVATATITYSPESIRMDTSERSSLFHYITPPQIPTTGATPPADVPQDRNSITFDWTPAGTGSVDLTIVYRVQISTSINFSSITTQSPELSFRSLSQPQPEWIATGLNLAGDTTYYWRVNAHVLGETNNFPSPAATPGSFKTVPVIPVLTTAAPTTATPGATPAATGTDTPAIVKRNPALTRIFRGSHHGSRVPGGATH